MLVLSRKNNEKVLIGNNIWITVVAVKGGQVRLGFEAPGDVKIDRAEVAHNAKDKSSEAA